MSPISAAVTAVSKAPIFAAIAQKAIPPVSKAFQVGKGFEFADKLRGVSQIAMG